MHPDLAIDDEWRRQDEEIEAGRKNNPPSFVRGVQHPNRAIRSTTDIQGQAVPRPLRSDSYREIRKRHEVRKTTDIRFH